MSLSARRPSSGAYRRSGTIPVVDDDQAARGFPAGALAGFIETPFQLRTLIAAFHAAPTPPEEG